RARAPRALGQGARALGRQRAGAEALGLRRVMSERETVWLEPGFVLHQRPYRNTSQLLECLTVGHGRVGLVARGSRRTASGQRALLQPFTPLRLSWLRRGDLGRLTAVEAEPERPRYELEPRALLAGYYANEVLLRLTARGDSNPEVFYCYSRCLAGLAAGEGIARSVRLFEWRLLRALGYGVELERDAVTGEPLAPEGCYTFELEHGPKAVAAGTRGSDVYSGADLIALREETLDTDDALRAAQRLLGRVLAVYLGDRPLKSRQVAHDI